MIKLIQNSYLITVALILVITAAFFLAWMLLDDSNNNLLSNRSGIEQPDLESIPIKMSPSATIRLPQVLAPLNITVTDLPVIILADDFTLVAPDYRQTSRLYGG
jgi:hypothetical protein